MARCWQCGAANAATKRFCGDCGAMLAVLCPACGTPAEPGKRFCGDCGALLVGPPTEPNPSSGNPSSGPPSSGNPSSESAGQGSAPRSAPISERRVCSVLFADLVGFTPLSESRDPEEVRELLSRYFDSARTVIGRYGGVVEKFIGDAVMAVWGTPVAAEGDTERAVRAALDLVAAVAALGDVLGVPDLTARAGVVTGEVAITIGATGEGMVAGNAVNTASRVQAAALPGSVLVDEPTRRLALASVGFEDAGEHTLKGKSEPEKLFRATRVLSWVGGLERSDALEAPLTGRDPELRTLKELFHATIDRRSPRLVVLSGPAGVGKSRLAWEFEKYVDGLADSVLWHRGRCLAYGEGVAFWALAEIVRQRFSIAEEDPAETAAAKLADGIVRLIPDPAEREYVGVRLGRLLGVAVEGDSGGSFGREELFAGWRLFFERLTASNPVVLLVEDAHHADEGLLDFLDHLVDWVRNLPVLVLVFARPELERRRPGFGSGRNRTALTLDPLDVASMDRLVELLVPGIPTSAKAAITAHSQGIPLFAVETVRSLIDRDVVVPRDGVYRLVGDVGELTVPESLHALLAGRLDTLEPAVRALVADAAVLGAAFPLEALVAVSGRSESDIRPALSELVRREVLEVSADPLSPQRGAYGFAQEMLRQVAYETLSRRDRKTRHLAVAAHLRSTFPGDGEEVADVVAQHYLDALGAVPGDPDASELATEAVEMLERAAERAERSGAPERAAASFAAAAELTSETAGDEQQARAARLWLRAAEAAMHATDWEGGAGYAEQARVLYDGLGLTRAAASAQAAVGRILRRSGRLNEALAPLTEALVVLRPEPDTDTIVTLLELGAIEVFTGGSQAEPIITEALVLGQSIGADEGLLAELCTVRGFSYAIGGRPAEAIAYLEYAVRVAEAAGDTPRRVRALANLSDSLGASDARAAAETGRTAVELCKRVGDRYLFVVAVSNLASALLFSGEWDEAAAVLASALEGGFEDSEMIQGVEMWLASLRGDADRAGSALSAVRSLRIGEDVQDQGAARACEAFASFSSGDHTTALGHARAVLDRIDQVGLRHELIRLAWPLAARSAHELGDEETVED
ncbi:MAG: AAA family ATPase, partial [Acidimicrobiales bacterium]